MLPNTETGFGARVNVGPSGSQLIYTLPFNKENAQNLFDIRDDSEEHSINSQKWSQRTGVGVKSQR